MQHHTDLLKFIAMQVSSLRYLFLGNNTDGGLCNHRAVVSTLLGQWTQISFLDALHMMQKYGAVPALKQPFGIVRKALF